jgi:hypothetical protein
MRAKVILRVSLLLNLGLLAAAILFANRVPPTPAAKSETLARESGSNAPKDHVIVRRQFFSWSELESTDYNAYIANLREIGCPETTIRDIIVADVNQLFAQRREKEIPIPEQPWWRSEPEWGAIQAAADKSKALEEERKALLAKLLGPNWDVTALAANRYTNGVAFTGAVLSQLSPETKTRVLDINSRAQARMEEYRLAQEKAGKPLDPVEMARLRQETRAELSQVLNSEQMEEYLLRYSATATQMRQELSGFNTTPDEFRQIFKLRDAYDQQLQLTYAGSDPAMIRKRREIEVQRDSSIRQAIGQERFRFYQLSQDPLFQQTRSTAVASGAPAEAVLPMYQVNQLAIKEQQRIKNDRTLSSEERDEALKVIQKDQELSLQKIIALRSQAEGKTNAPAMDMPPLPGN